MIGVIYVGRISVENRLPIEGQLRQPKGYFLLGVGDLDSERGSICAIYEY